MKFLNLYLLDCNMLQCFGLLLIVCVICAAYTEIARFNLNDFICLLAFILLLFYLSLITIKLLLVYEFMDLEFSEVKFEDSKILFKGDIDSLNQTNKLDSNESTNSGTNSENSNVNSGNTNVGSSESRPNDNLNEVSHESETIEPTSSSSNEVKESNKSDTKSEVLDFMDTLTKNYESVNLNDNKAGPAIPENYFVVDAEASSKYIDAVMEACENKVLNHSARLINDLEVRIKSIQSQLSDTTNLSQKEIKDLEEDLDDAMTYRELEIKFVMDNLDSKLIKTEAEPSSADSGLKRNNNFEANQESEKKRTKNDSDD